MRELIGAYERRLLAVLIMAGTVLAIAAGHAATASGRLQVKVVGLKHDGGQVHFALFQSKEGFGDSDTAVAKGRFPVIDKKCEIVISHLPFGEYAILLGHDVDGDGKISRNPFSRELKGASNYTSKMWYFPDFDKAKFVLEAEELTVEVRVY